MKIADLETILASLAKTIQEERDSKFQITLEGAAAYQRASERLMVIWEIQDVLNDVDMSKRDKINAISDIVEAALKPEDDHLEDDWGYQ